MHIVDQLLKVALLGSAWVLYLVLVLSVLSIGVIAERFLFFMRNSRRGGPTLRSALLVALATEDHGAVVGLLRESGSVEGAVVAAAYAFREGGGPAVGDAVEAELAAARHQLEKGLNFLGTIGNNAPFIGLFGTVIGVIVAFQELGQAGGRAEAMGSVMAGIAEALVATGVGLFVALPAVIAYNIAQKRVGDIEAEAVALGRLVAASLETRARGGRVYLGAEPPIAAADEKGV